MVLLFLGPSGSGKDTQAQLIAVKSSFQMVSTGDLFRDISNGSSVIQTYIKRLMTEKSPFRSDMIAFGLLQIYMQFARGDDFILNGAVRRHSQIELLDRTLADIDQKVDYVFNFIATEDILIERLGNRLYCKVCKSNFNLKTNPPKDENMCDRCGSALFKREDDNPESIRNRLQEFAQNNDKIIEHYKSQNILSDIDAERPSGEIHIDLWDKINKLSN